MPFTSSAALSRGGSSPPWAVEAAAATAVAAAAAAGGWMTGGGVETKTKGGREGARDGSSAVHCAVGGERANNAEWRWYDDLSLFVIIWIWGKSCGCFVHLWALVRDEFTVWMRLGPAGASM
jgi:hypothetical protein